MLTMPGLLVRYLMKVILSTRYVAIVSPFTSSWWLVDVLRSLFRRGTTFLGKLAVDDAWLDCVLLDESPLFLPICRGCISFLVELAVDDVLSSLCLQLLSVA